MNKFNRKAAMYTVLVALGFFGFFALGFISETFAFTVIGILSIVAIILMVFLVYGTIDDILTRR